MVSQLQKNVVLSALASSNDLAALSPVQIQKLFFVLDRELGPFIEGPVFNFQPYDYGPFDKAVYETFATLSLEGLASVRISGSYHVYSLTPDGVSLGRRILSQYHPDVQRFIGQALTWVRSLSFETLVASIYERYPDMKVNSVFKS